MEPKQEKATEHSEPGELKEENLEVVSGGLTTSKTVEPINGGPQPAEPPGARKIDPING